MLRQILTLAALVSLAASGPIAAQPPPAGASPRSAVTRGARSSGTSARSDGIARPRFARGGQRWRPRASRATRWTRATTSEATTASSRSSCSRGRSFRDSDEERFMKISAFHLMPHPIHGAIFGVGDDVVRCQFLKHFEHR